MKKVNVIFPNGQTGEILETEYKSRVKKGHKIKLNNKELKTEPETKELKTQKEIK